MSLPLNEALAVADRLEKEDCIGTTSQALRTLRRAYLELLDEYHAYEEEQERYKEPYQVNFTEQN